MSKAAEAGKAFLAGVLAKITNPDQRAQVEAAFNDAANADALVVVGAGALAQSDINRKYQELQDKETQLTEDYNNLNTWYATKKTDLEELETLRKGGKGNNPPPARTETPEIDPTKFIGRDEFGKLLMDEQLKAANYMGLMNALTLQHFQHFNEVIDTRELLADPRLGKLTADGSRVYGLKDAYDTKYHDKIAEREKRLSDESINKQVEERVAERMKTAPRAEFPLKGSPSALDLLEPGAEFKPESFTAQAAADEYLRLQQARTT